MPRDILSALSPHARSRPPTWLEGAIPIFGSFRQSEGLVERRRRYRRKNASRRRDDSGSVPALAMEGRATCGVIDPTLVLQLLELVEKILRRFLVLELDGAMINRSFVVEVGSDLAVFLFATQVLVLVIGT